MPDYSNFNPRSISLVEVCSGIYQLHVTEAVSPEKATRWFMGCYALEERLQEYMQGTPEKKEE